MIKTPGNTEFFIKRATFKPANEMRAIRKDKNPDIVGRRLPPAFFFIPSSIVSFPPPSSREFLSYPAVFSILPWDQL